MKKWKPLSCMLKRKHFVQGIKISQVQESWVLCTDRNIGVWPHTSSCILLRYKSKLHFVKWCSRHSCFSLISLISLSRIAWRCSTGRFPARLKIYISSVTLKPLMKPQKKAQMVFGTVRHWTHFTDSSNQLRHVVRIPEECMLFCVCVCWDARIRRRKQL